MITTKDTKVHKVNPLVETPSFPPIFRFIKYFLTNKNLFNQTKPQFISVAFLLLFINKKGNKMFGNLGATEILIIIGVISLLFGAKRIPEIAKSIGKGIHDFKKEIKSIEEITK